MELFGISFGLFEPKCLRITSLNNSVICKHIQNSLEGIFLTEENKQQQNIMWQRISQ